MWRMQREGGVRARGPQIVSLQEARLRRAIFRPRSDLDHTIMTARLDMAVPRRGDTWLRRLRGQARLSHARQKDQDCDLINSRSPARLAFDYVHLSLA